MKPRSVDGSILKALMRLWGIDYGLLEEPGKPPARFLPDEFKVFEIKSEAWLKGSGWSLYFVKKKGISTILAASMLRKRLRAERVSYSGLKDSWGTSFQYMAFHNPEETPLRIIDDRIEAWYVGESSFIPLGSHYGNVFRIVLECENPELVCSRVYELESIPGFYGPQRFGILRPSSHIYALRMVLKESGWLLREYAYRYPLEEKENILGYEAKAISRALKTMNFWDSLATPPRVAIDSLQSYLFNRALSKALKLGIVDEVSETKIRFTACNKIEKTPHSRLPSIRLLKSKTRWAQIVREICEEEGITPRMLPVRAPLRALLYPVDVKACKARSSRAEITLCLPPSAYATIVLFKLIDLNFLIYK